MSLLDETNLRNTLDNIRAEVNGVREDVNRLRANSPPAPTPEPPPPAEPIPVPAPGTHSFGCGVGMKTYRDYSTDRPTGPWRDTDVTGWEGELDIEYVDTLKAIVQGNPIRFMDAWRTNGDLNRNGGISDGQRQMLDRQIELCNACGSDFYGNILFYDSRATIEYKVGRVRQRLNPDRERYWEWINEPWNLGTNVSKEIQRLSGRERFGGGADLAYFDVWAAHNSDALRIVKDADPDCITVLGCHTANPWVAEKVEDRMTFKPDAHGLTAYFGSGLGGTPNPDTTVDDILTASAAKIESKEIPRMIASIAFAKSLGRQTIAYEGGPHYTLKAELHESHRGVWQAMNQANRDPRIIPLIERVDSAWFAAGGGKSIKYTYLSLYGPWGAFGLGEKLNTIRQSVKYRHAAGVAA